MTVTKKGKAMNAMEKTKDLQRVFLPVSSLVENEENPNRMTAQAFNLLCDNIQKTGITDAIIVKPIEDGKYRIVGGHHRARAAIYLDMAEVPCTIITDPDFDDEMEAFQLVRMNVIHGKIDPESFLDMYDKYRGKYSDDILQDSFGFADEAEFRKLIQQTKKSLPKEMQKAFMDAAKEVKTIEDLAKILNELFDNYGDTLDSGYMIVDFGGKDSVWLRMGVKDRPNFMVLADFCRKNKRTVDGAFSAVLQLIANGNLNDLILDKTTALDYIFEEGQIPTLDGAHAN